MAKKKKSTKVTKAVKRKATKKAKLLSGGNPQIAKGYGDAPVQKYIAAMPGWKKAMGQKIDRLVEKANPKIQKAVKWNSPFYGREDDHWFLNFHCFAKYIKVAFFEGTALTPPPPEASSHKTVRYLHIYEDKPFDEAQFTSWVKQASKLSGMKM